MALAFDPVSHDLLLADRSNDRIERFATCGATAVALSVLPQTQAMNLITDDSGTVTGVLTHSLRDAPSWVRAVP